MAADLVAVASRRRSFSSGTYNPLVGKLSEISPDTWVCVVEHGVYFYDTEECEGDPVKEVPIGAHVEATKDGSLLREKETGLYAHFFDKDGTRHFKNQRLLMLERTAVERPDEGLFRSGSKTSAGPVESAMDAFRTFSRTGSWRGDTGGPLVHRMSSKQSAAGGDITSRRASFRWVDATGESHRLEGASEELSDVRLRPEVWVCVADHDIPYRNSPVLADYASFGQDCKVGQRVNAIKEDGWLRVFEVRSSFDTGAAIGRRSFSAATTVTIEETGLYLPFSEGDRTLFKNNKLVLFEDAGKFDPTVYAKKESSWCPVM